MRNLIKNDKFKTFEGKIKKEFEQSMPEIAKWYNNFDCAVSFRFDDNNPSHVKFVIPLLNKYGFKSTFMVNPGRNYKKYKNFWENELPVMGHKLGNHTWHHHGAKNPEEAEFEIGEVSKLIWRLYPDDSKLNVFASGGGELWGGKRWHRTFPEYREIPEKYNLIDLYDGKHKGLELNSDFTQEEIENKIKNAIIDKKHQAFIFHKIGNKSLTDYLRKIVKNFNYTLGKEQFLKLIKYLHLKRNLVWVAPLIQIYKYEEELNSTKLEILSEEDYKVTLSLRIDTDPNLYDQDLTLILPILGNKFPINVFQNKDQIPFIKVAENEYLSNVKPVESQISIIYN